MSEIQSAMTVDLFAWEKALFNWIATAEPSKGCVGLKLPANLKRRVQLVCMQAVSDCPLVEKHDVEVRVHSTHDLDLAVDTCKPVKVLDLAPGEIATVCMPGSCANRYAGSPRYRVMFERVMSPPDVMDIDDAKAHPGKLTRQIYYQIQHNMLEPLLRSAEPHVEDMKAAHTWWCLRMLDSEFNAEFKREAFMFEVFCWGMFALSIVGQEKAGVRIFKLR